MASTIGNVDPAHRGVFPHLRVWARTSRGHHFSFCIFFFSLGFKSCALPYFLLLAVISIDWKAAARRRHCSEVEDDHLACWCAEDWRGGSRVAPAFDRSTFFRSSQRKKTTEIKLFQLFQAFSSWLIPTTSNQKFWGFTCILMLFDVSVSYKNLI